MSAKGAQKKSKKADGEPVVTAIAKEDNGTTKRKGSSPKNNGKSATTPDDVISPRRQGRSGGPPPEIPKDEPKLRKPRTPKSPANNNTSNGSAAAVDDSKEEKTAANGKSRGKAKAKAKATSKAKKRAANGDDNDKEESEDAAEKKEVKTHNLSAERIKEMEDFPTIDLSRYLDRKGEDGEWKKDCETIAKCLHHYGFLIVKDPRVSMQDNDTFIDTLEKYYGQSEEKKALDVRPDLHYQVGITPTRTERARDHCSRVSKLAEDERPLTICPPDLDNKLRFFWRIGARPAKTEFKQLNAEPVIPADFPEWPKVMDRWGTLILSAIDTVAEMAARGFDMPPNTFTDMMKFGPHLLAPTGSDFNKFGKLGSILASYHYDLNFLTIHGRSRFPGLFIWTRDGKKLAVKVPPQCLLLQAGKQFEILTGGHVLAGFHEVVVVNDTVAAIDKAKAAGKSLWRVSSTLFGHIASDQVLKPLGKFATPVANEKYPAIKAGQQVQEELNAIKLGKGAIVAAM